eukprot:jgi/Galph1/4388/GphlegSOOS_G3053.1
MDNVSTRNKLWLDMLRLIALQHVNWTIQLGKCQRTAMSVYVASNIGTALRKLNILKTCNYWKRIGKRCLLLIYLFIIFFLPKYTLAGVSPTVTVIQQQEATISPPFTRRNVSFSPSSASLKNWRYTQLLKAVKKGKVAQVVFSSDQSQLLAIAKDGNRYKLNALPPDPNLMSFLIKHKVDVNILPRYTKNGPMQTAKAFLFSLPFLFLMLFVQRLLLNGPLTPFDFQRASARIPMSAHAGVTFDDVAGYENVKTELQEIVEFVRNPEAFSYIGAKIPRGMILEGPPGTGKTLLARAVAGEAGVPFFSIAGSEFVEMFVGVGASRVRDLFAQAKRNAPCIIFIDEIDAVGRQRGAGIAGGNDEREQTLNQLLTEMDGFEENKGIMVMAATNRSDVLDRALLRPGRLDRRIVVSLPDMSTRIAILKVHARGKALSDSVDLESIARRTPGFSGAALQNLMNEAAIFAARREHNQITMEDFEDTMDRILLGPQKKQWKYNEHYKQLVAYHEAGHALVGALCPNYDQVLKISIVPRGGAGGLTFFSPLDESRIENGLYSRQYLESQLAVGLGGRIAEELVFGEDQVTTGAANDFQHVTNTARQMITKFGMSSVLGPMYVNETSGFHPFLGREVAIRGQSSNVSSETKWLIDQEVSRIVEKAYQRARTVLEKNRPILDKLANMLIEQETVSSEELHLLLSENEVFMMPYEEEWEQQTSLSTGLWQKYNIQADHLENNGDSMTFVES